MAVPLFSTIESNLQLNKYMSPTDHYSITTVQ